MILSYYLSMVTGGYFIFFMSVYIKFQIVYISYILENIISLQVSIILKIKDTRI